MTQSDEKKPDGMWGLIAIAGVILAVSFIPTLVDAFEDLINLIS